MPTGPTHHMILSCPALIKLARAIGRVEYLLYCSWCFIISTVVQVKRIGEQQATGSLDIWPVPCIGSYRVLLCVDNGSFYINSQCFKLLFY